MADTPKGFIPRLIIPTSFEEAMSYFEDIYILKQAVIDLDNRVKELEANVNEDDEN